MVENIFDGYGDGDGEKNIDRRLRWRWRWIFFSSAVTVTVKFFFPGGDGDGDGEFFFLPRWRWRWRWQKIKISRWLSPPTVTCHRHALVFPNKIFLFGKLIVFDSKFSPSTFGTRSVFHLFSLINFFSGKLMEYGQGGALGPCYLFAYW